MRIIIPGGSGLIGNALIPALLGDGHEVWVLSRHPEQVTLPGSAQVAAWDGRTGQGWEHILEGSDVVINLAGENIGASPWSEDRLQRIRGSRLHAGEAIIDGLKRVKARPQLLIQQSAKDCYGASQTQTFDESSPLGSGTLAGICALWEASTQPAEDFGIRRIITRTSLYLTRQGGVLPRLMLPFQLFAGGPLGSGRQWYSWIHYRDWVEAIRFFINSNQARGIYNLTSPTPVTNAEFGRTLAWVLRRPYLLPAPAFALRLALGKMSSMILEGQRVVPKRLMESGFEFRFSQLHQALEDILRA
jgi:uncharacterized protein (TIGR01777 family)